MASTPARGGYLGGLAGVRFSVWELRFCAGSCMRGGGDELVGKSEAGI